MQCMTASSGGQFWLLKLMVNLRNIYVVHLWHYCMVWFSVTTMVCSFLRSLPSSWTRLIIEVNEMHCHQHHVTPSRSWTFVAFFLAARNHVNRMCLAADIPLVESGTAGYLGQVTVIKKGMFECYECHPVAAQKTYPGCTIRNTPSEPIHCIVWSKHLFKWESLPANNDI